MVIARSERLSHAETARLVGVHVASVWRWTLDGVRGRKLPTVLIAGRRYILKTDLETFLATGNEPRPPNDADFTRRAQDAGRLLDARGVRPRQQIIKPILPVG